MSKDNETIEILLLNTKQVAEALQISERYVFDLLADGQLPSLKIGGSRRIELAEVQRFIRERADDTYKMERGSLTLRIQELDRAESAVKAPPSPR